MRIFLLVVLLMHFSYAQITSTSSDFSIEPLCESPSDVAIAVGTVDMANKSAKLVFSDSGIANMLSVAIKQSNCFRVIDWQHMNDVIKRHQLEWSDIANNTSSRQKLQKLLKADYFLVASINSFSSDVEYSNSLFSKEKIQHVNLTLDLTLKNALTNEYIKSFSANGASQKEMSNTLGFGAGANNSSKVANLALQEALTLAMKSIATQKLAKLAPSASQESLVELIDVNAISDSMQKLVKESNANACSGKWVNVTGYATMQKGSYQAKKRALMDAYKSAVAIGSGVDVKSFSQVSLSDSLSQAFSFMSEKSTGFISYYKVLSSHKTSANGYEVALKACVNSSEATLSDKEISLRKFVDVIENPSLLIVLGQKELDKHQGDGLNIRSVEVAMGEFFTNLGYEVTLSDDLVGRGITNEAKVQKARLGSGGYAIEIARDMGADMLISGALVFDKEQSQLGDAKGSLISASFNAKMIMPGGGKVLKLYNETSQTLNLASSTLLGQEGIIKKTALKMAYAMAWDFPKYLLEEEREIEVLLKNVSYKTYKNIKRTLKNQEEILGVKDLGRWKKKHKNLGEIRLVLKSSYLGVSSDDILETLDAFSPEVENVGEYYLEISIGR